MATAPKPKSRSNPKKPKVGVPDNEKSGISAAGSRGILSETDERNLCRTVVSNEEKHQLIAEAAYFRAQQRNFVPGHELDDWLTAEAEIEVNLS
jgi:hypothetical protein